MRTWLGVIPERADFMNNVRDMKTPEEMLTSAN